MSTEDRRGEGRRFSDKIVDTTSEAIREMIMRAETDEQRATLLLLQQLSENIIKSNNALVDLARNFGDLQSKFANHLDTFEHHAEEEMKLINKGLGGWRAVAIVGPLFLGALGTVATWELNRHLTAMEVNGDDVRKMSYVVQELKLRQEVIGAQIDRNGVMLDTHLGNTHKPAVPTTLPER